MLYSKTFIKGSDVAAFDLIILPFGTEENTKKVMGSSVRDQ